MKFVNPELENGAGDSTVALQDISFMIWKSPPDGVQFCVPHGVRWYWSRQNS